MEEMDDFEHQDPEKLYELEEKPKTKKNITYNNLIESTDTPGNSLWHEKNNAEERSLGASDTQHLDEDSSYFNKGRSRNRLETRLEELQRDVANLTMRLRANAGKTIDTSQLETIQTELTASSTSPIQSPQRIKHSPKHTAITPKRIKKYVPSLEIEEEQNQKKVISRSAGRVTASARTARELRDVTLQRDQLRFELEKSKKSIASLQRRINESNKYKSAYEKLKKHALSLQESLDLSERIRVRQKRLIQQLQQQQQQQQKQPVGPKQRVGLSKEKTAPRNAKVGSTTGSTNDPRRAATTTTTPKKKLFHWETFEDHDEDEEETETFDPAMNDATQKGLNDSKASFGRSLASGRSTSPSHVLDSLVGSIPWYPSSATSPGFGNKGPRRVLSSPPTYKQSPTIKTMETPLIIEKEKLRRKTNFDSLLSTPQPVIRRPVPHGKTSVNSSAVRRTMNTSRVASSILSTTTIQKKKAAKKSLTQIPRITTSSGAPPTKPIKKKTKSINKSVMTSTTSPRATIRNKSFSFLAPTQASISRELSTRKNPTKRQPFR